MTFHFLSKFILKNKGSKILILNIFQTLSFLILLFLIFFKDLFITIIKYFIIIIHKYVYILIYFNKDI